MPVTIGQLDNVPAPGDPIRSPWAQEISSYAVHPYASVAALTAGWPTATKGCMAVAGTKLMVYDGTQWVEIAATVDYPLGTQAGISAAVTIPGSGFTFTSNQRIYRVDIMVHVFKGGGTGDVTITPNVAGLTIPPMAWQIQSPGRTTCYGVWRIAGSYSGGAFVIGTSPGTLDIQGGGHVTVTDCGGV